MERFALHLGVRPHGDAGVRSVLCDHPLMQSWGSYVTYAIALRIDRQISPSRRDEFSKVGLAAHSAGTDMSRSSSFKGLSASAATSSLVMHELAHGDPRPPLASDEPHACHRQAQTPSPESSKSDARPGRVPLPASEGLKGDRQHQEQWQA